MARVLVVDDDANGLETRRMVLEQSGYLVTVARDVHAARAAFRSVAPSTVILDLRLPGAEDGLSLIREFRAVAPDLKIVVLCGWSGDIEGRTERTMVDEVLAKPARSESLLRAIARVA